MIELGSSFKLAKLLMNDKDELMALIACQCKPSNCYTISNLDKINESSYAGNSALTTNGDLTCGSCDDVLFPSSTLKKIDSIYKISKFAGLCSFLMTTSNTVLDEEVLIIKRDDGDSNVIVHNI